MQLAIQKVVMKIKNTPLDEMNKRLKDAENNQLAINVNRIIDTIQKENPNEKD